MIFGHERQQHFFEHAIEHGQLSHAYCFIGEDGIGKKQLALYLAKKLLQTQEPTQHPDYLYIAQEKNEKTGKTKKFIDVEQIKRVREFFSRFAAMGGYRVVIIDGAERLNEHASNALLKTLEELPKQSIIFFITNNEQQMMKTILSRSQQFYFMPLSLQHMTRFAEHQTQEVSADMIRHAHGRPGLLHSWLEDEQAYADHQQRIRDFSSLWNERLYQKIKIVEPLFGSKQDHIATRRELEDVLDTWMLLLRDYYLHESGNSQLAIHEKTAMTTLNKENMIPLIQRMASAKKLLRQNVHPRLIIEDILLDIS